MDIKTRRKHEPLHYRSPGIDRTEGHAAPDGTTVPSQLDHQGPCTGRGTGAS